MSKHACFIAAALWAAMQLTPPPALAATPIDFDCDVPADHFSSVSQDASGPVVIKGTVLAVQMRSGNYRPLAGVRVTSADDMNIVGFRLIDSSSRAKHLDVKLNMMQGRDLKEVTEGQVSAEVALPFTFSFSESGQVTLSIGGSIFQASFMPFANAKVMVFCSTGQFKFTDILLPSANSSSN